MKTMSEWHARTWSVPLNRATLALLSAFTCDARILERSTEWRDVGTISAFYM